MQGPEKFRIVFKTLTHPHCTHAPFYKIHEELKTYFKGLAIDIF